MVLLLYVVYTVEAQVKLKHKVSNQAQAKAHTIYPALPYVTPYSGSHDTLGYYQNSGNGRAGSSRKVAKYFIHFPNSKFFHNQNKNLMNVGH